VEVEPRVSYAVAAGSLGGQIFAAGFRWDVAAILGLTDRDPSTGVTFGVSKDLALFEHMRLLR